MKRIYWAMGLAGLLAATTARADLIISTVNTVIPDNDPAGLQDTLVVSGFEQVIDTVEVWLRISAAPSNLAWNGDLFVSLQHDTGYAVLLNRVGRTAGVPLGYGDNGLEVTFTLAGTDIHGYQNDSPVFDGDGRLIGTWGVDGRDIDPDDVLDTDTRTDMLGNFAGLNPNGNWTLFVADLNQNGVAQLDEWGLDITVIPEPGTMGLFVLGVLAFYRRRRA